MAEEKIVLLTKLPIDVYEDYYQWRLRKYGDKAANNDQIFKDPKWEEYLRSKIEPFTSLPRGTKEKNERLELGTYIDDMLGYVLEMPTEGDLKRYFQVVQKLPNVISGTNPTSVLPNWYFEEEDWLVGRGKIIASQGESVGDLTKYGNNYYKFQNGFAKKLPPEAAQFELQKHFETNKDKLTENQIANLNLAYENLNYQKRQDFANRQVQENQWLGNMNWQRQKEANALAMQERTFGLQEREARTKEIETQAALEAKPRNWIQAWLRKRGLEAESQNRNVLQERAFEGNWLKTQALENLGRATDVMTGANIYAPERATWEQAQADASQRYYDIASAYNPAIQAQSAEAARAASTGYAGMEAPGNKVMTPPTPTWLASFVPELRGKTNLDKYGVVRPSLQQWEATPKSTQQGLAGYMDWSDYQSYEDMLDEMNRTRTRSPYYAGRQVWRPTRSL